MRKTITRILAVGLTTALMAGLAGCGSEDVYTESGKASLSYDDAVTEMNSMMTKVDPQTVKNPVLDIYSDEVSEADSLADIDTFDLTVTGEGEINLEIAAATEMSSEAPDDWLNVVAKNFNKEKYTVDGKEISVSVRQITSGEAVTYINAGIYQPELFIPSNTIWGKMLEASGVGITQRTDRIAGNTAGILIKTDVYDAFIDTYKEATVANILQATLDGELTFAYSNPYTSSTGINILSAMLYAFDSEDPLSEQAQEKLLEYQKQSPPVAYTTAVLRNQAAKGVINAMVMEEQAYINTPDLKNYKYIPAGIRHDHPVYSFDWDTDEEQEAADLFIEYCQNEKNQKLASDKGFNRHDDYVSEDTGMSGSDYLMAQKVWKQNKNGGKPVMAVFIADVSGSMDGEPLNSLKQSLVSASSYISSEHYIGLVSYAGGVTINLPIRAFDPTQHAYFTGEVKNLTAGGSTATYDAVLTGLQMLAEASEEVPDAKKLLFVLSDGQQNEGYSLSRVTSIIDGMEVPVYTIAYNFDESEELETLSGINEAAALHANSDDITNQLRNLFNVEM